METSINPRRMLFGMFAAALACGGLAGCGGGRGRVEPAAAEMERGAAKQDAVQNEAAWSEMVNGLQARIELRHDRVYNGTPVLTTFLFLRNSGWRHDDIEVAWAAKSMTFSVVDAACKKLSRGHKGGGMYSGMGGRSPLDLMLPYEGTLSFDISGHGMGYAGDQVAGLDLGAENNWLLSKEDGQCWLHATLEIPEVQEENKGDGRPRVWHGRIELPPVAIPTRVPPLDPAMADKLIAEWGAAMVQPDYDYEAQEASKKLSLVADSRVIPWYLKAMDSGDTTLKEEALDRLARFDGDEAFAGVKRGLATQASDIDNCPPAAAAGWAERIRSFAVDALARSPHPQARPLLFSLWNDPANGVRLSVVFALGNTKSPESTALLKRMCDDPDDNIRNQAREYLEDPSDEVAKPAGGGEKSEQ